MLARSSSPCTAVLCVQSIFRMHQQLTRMRLRRRATVAMQCRYRGGVVRAHHARMLHATVLFQAAVRRFRRRRQV
jgi:hypothetical protein